MKSLLPAAVVKLGYQREAGGGMLGRTIPRSGLAGTGLTTGGGCMGVSSNTKGPVPPTRTVLEGAGVRAGGGGLGGIAGGDTRAG